MKYIRTFRYLYIHKYSYVYIYVQKYAFTGGSNIYIYIYIQTHLLLQYTEGRKLIKGGSEKDALDSYIFKYMNVYINVFMYV
jgi:hypothetical protein